MYMRHLQLDLLVVVVVAPHDRPTFIARRKQKIYPSGIPIMVRRRRLDRVRPTDIACVCMCVCVCEPHARRVFRLEKFTGGRILSYGQTINYNACDAVVAENVVLCFCKRMVVVSRI